MTNAGLPVLCLLNMVSELAESRCPTHQDRLRAAELAMMATCAKSLSNLGSNAQPLAKNATYAGGSHTGAVTTVAASPS
jgi:hypothetical protein